jgi:hypothetical protein
MRDEDSSGSTRIDVVGRFRECSLLAFLAREILKDPGSRGLSPDCYRAPE